jgi:hypothetical protein
MHRRAIRRGIFALAVVTSVPFAGARPAAARDLGVVAQLNHLWSTLEPGAWMKLAGWLNGDKPTKKGWGMDPNGTEPPPPTGGNSITVPSTSDPTGLL